MALTITHAFESLQADGLDDTVVQPSDWNDPHVITGAMADFDTACSDGNFAFQNQAGAFTTLSATELITASKGVAFPATQVVSADANTIDDYEKGTFTPTVYGSTTAGTPTYSVQDGSYTKVGRLVTYRLYVSWTAISGPPAGDLRIGGLPFASANVTNKLSVGACYHNNISLTANNVMQVFVPANETFISVNQVAIGGGTSTAVAIDTAGYILVSGHYEV